MLLFGFFAAISLFASVDHGIRRVQANLLIDDPLTAVQEAKDLALKHPDSRTVQSTLVEALAAAKKEEESFEAWQALSLKHPDLIQDRRLLEELAWGVLRKGLDSTQNGVRLAALIGVYLTHDVRTVPILCKMMRDSNAVIRSVAIQMACSYQDAALKDEMVRMIEEEKVWIVRLEVIKAIGAMKMQGLSTKLRAIIQSDKSTYEERHLAIVSLLNIYEKASLSQFQDFASSNRAGIRHLACSIAAHFELDEAKEAICKLIHDPHPDVRIAALNAFGLYYWKKVPTVDAMELLANALDDPNPAVSITAGWAATIAGSFGSSTLKKWLMSPLAENRRLAAAATAATGSKGITLALQTMQDTDDLYVKANLSIGLLGQRTAVSTACDCIYQFLTAEKKMWMWDNRPNPLFQVLAPSQVRHIDHIPNYPEAIDQLTRLNLVSLLAIVEDPRANEALKTFLQKRSWGISGVAAATLLQEGDESALEIVRECLKDRDPNIQLQASLVLAMMGRDPSVLRDLQGAYAGANHERKLHILEALGRIGDPRSFSFLVGVFKEPFPILRIASAAALIQCINK